MVTCITLLIALVSSIQLHAQDRVLIPMDASQNDHLKAYGVIFNHLLESESGQWLLNYRGGSFITRNSADIVQKARIKGVTVEMISQGEARQITEC